MHMPDGFLTLQVAAIAFLIDIPFWILSFKKVRRTFDEKTAPLFGTLTALIFAAQMVNWPIGPGGTTGHLIGSPLVSILLTPYSGVIALSIILLVQALVFNDGGITTYGGNVLSMAVVGSFVGYATYKTTFKLLSKLNVNKRTKLIIASFLGGWLGITSAALSTGIQLGLSSSVFGYGLSITIPVMVVSHAIIGLGEGAITATVVYYISKVRPDLVKEG
ncbi:MAG: energy-coupling factor ABC transporter permease [Thermoproteota archaeon]